MKKKWGALALAGVLGAAVVTGCSTGGNGEATEKQTSAGSQVNAETSATGEEGTAESQGKEDLVFVNYRDIRDLNPHLYAGEMYAQEMLYETLVNITADGYEGCLAESWDISEDGKTYTFHKIGRASCRERV